MSVLVAITNIDQLDLNQEFTPGVRADLAQTTHITFHGRSTDQWYRRYPHPFESDQRRIWRSVAGGTPAPTFIANALNESQI